MRSDNYCGLNCQYGQSSAVLSLQQRMTYSYTKEKRQASYSAERDFILTFPGHHSNWSGRVLETPVSMEGQHLQSGLVQSPPLRGPLLHSLSHIQIYLNWRKQGDRV